MNKALPCPPVQAPKQLRFGLMDLLWVAIAVNAVMFLLDNSDRIRLAGGIDPGIIPFITYSISSALIGIHRANELGLHNPFARALCMASVMSFLPGMFTLLVSLITILYVLYSNNPVWFSAMPLIAGILMTGPAIVLHKCFDKKPGSNTPDNETKPEAPH